MKWTFIVFLVYVGSLFFREERLPTRWVERIVEGHAPTNIVFHLDSLSVGLMRGVHIRGLRVYDTAASEPMEPLVMADSVSVRPLLRRLRIEGLKYSRLPESYYLPGNFSKDERVGVVLPEVPRFSLTLVRPEILGVAPERVVADVELTGNRLTVGRIRLDWPDQDESMSLDGVLKIDFVSQVVEGSVKGFAKQHHIRPLLEAVDVPVAFPYFDAFTEVPCKVPAYCGWHVNLVNNDFDLDLDLHPTMGKYNGVPMKSADGKIHLHVYTRDNCLNYRQTIGPISARGLKDEALNGTVIVTGTNGYNTVDVEARSAMAVADILKIGGFTGEYVGEDVFGKSECKLQFRFPRAMTNNYEVLNGEGHLSIRDGMLMRLKGFKGLLDAMPSIAPAVSWLSDSTQASCDYVIENGVLKTENIYIEGSVFSIKMYGAFDTVRNALDFTVRVQFTKKDSLVGKLLHPLTWPFTKLLLEFKLTGTTEAPQWKYLSVVDRVLEVIQ